MMPLPRLLQPRRSQPRLSRPRLSRKIAAVGVAVPLVLVAACSSGTTSNKDDSSDAKSTLTVYTDQHAELIEALTSAYTKKTGAKFKIQQDATVGQIEAEGKAAPADVYLSEDPGPAAQLAKKDMLVPLKNSTLDQVQPGLSSDKGQWVAYAARARVLYYYPGKIKEEKLPKTLLDINDPEYKGKFAWAPSGAFVATTQYMLSTIGKDKTTEFLKGLKTNGVNEHKNGNVRDTVEAGKHAMGLSNHYYWWIKAAEIGGPDNMKSKIYHFPNKGPGNLLLSSGAGILKTSKHQKEAAAFIKWLSAKDGGQEAIASGDIDSSGAQYPVAVGSSSKIVGSLTDIQSPEFDMDTLADQGQAEDLLKKLGMSS